MKQFLTCPRDIAWKVALWVTTLKLKKKKNPNWRVPYHGRSILKFSHTHKAEVTISNHYETTLFSLPYCDYQSWHQIEEHGKASPKRPTDSFVCVRLWFWYSGAHLQSTLNTPRLGVNVYFLPHTWLLTWKMFPAAPAEIIPQVRGNDHAHQSLKKAVLFSGPVGFMDALLQVQQDTHTHTHGMPNRG